MRLLVTGGAGFIGSHFVRHALAEGASVTTLDKLTYAGKLENLADIRHDRRHRFLRGDICDRTLLAEVVPGHDAIAHFAAESHVDRSIEAVDPFVQTNVVGTQRLLDAARTAKVKRFLLISTDEVYGSVPAPHRSDERAPLQPNSPYAATKAAADLLARSYHLTYEMPVIITRASNNFGPYHFPEKMIPLFITNLLDGDNVPLYGEGANVRDWLFVLDNVRAQWLILTQGKHGETYNVGAGNDITNIELTQRLLKHLNLGEDRISHVSDRPGHDLRYAVDTKKIEALGWAPEYQLDEALSRTIDWYRKHTEWWRPLKEHDVRRGMRRG